MFLERYFCFVLFETSGFKTVVCRSQVVKGVLIGASRGHYVLLLFCFFFDLFETSGFKTVVYRSQVVKGVLTGASRRHYLLLFFSISLET